MEILPIRDSLFSHAFSSSNWFKPRFFEWGFNKAPDKFVFLTDRNVYEARRFDCKRYAWLLESQAVTPSEHEFVLNNARDFDLIFTHSSKILAEVPHAVIVPPGGCHLDEADIRLDHAKSKLCSMMYSHKTFAPAQHMRFEVAKRFGDKVECMGSGKTPGVNVPKAAACKDFKFQIAIENFSDGHYFTEKIVDCFLSGCVPIYCGCPNIGAHFDPNGFFTFTTLEELDAILNLDLTDFYDEHFAAIEQNFHRALKYKVAEDFMWENYKGLILK